MFPPKNAAFRESPDEEVVAYRPVSLTAVAGLLLGIASVAALIGPLFWFLPLLGLIVNGAALAQIGREGQNLVGRKAALAGLSLSILFGTAAPVERATTEWWLADEARKVGLEWFADLQQGLPERAHQLGMAPAIRSSATDDAQLWNYYRNSPDNRRELEQFVAMPLVRTLLALGPRAEARLYRTAGVVSADKRETVVQLYAVTYTEQGAKRTFLVSLTLDRTIEPRDERVAWRIMNLVGGVRLD